MILFFFELCYAVRFIFDKFDFWMEFYSFGYLVVYDLVIMLDGLSFLALLTFHYRNFSGPS